jgi:hypothetical protein
MSILGGEVQSAEIGDLQTGVDRFIIFMKREGLYFVTDLVLRNETSMCE